MAPPQTWIFDAPTGVYKNHALSNELFEAALEKSAFMDHVRPVEGYGIGRGESITLTRVSNIAEPDDPTLDELNFIPQDEITLSTQQITVKEIGRSVPYTSLSTDLSKFDLLNPIQSKLRAQLTLTLDTLAAKGFKNTQLKARTTSDTVIDIVDTGSFSGASSNNLTVAHLETIRDYMFDDKVIPPAVDNDYIGIFRTLAIRGIKNDEQYEQWQKYTDPSAKFNSEVGRWEGIRLIETNHEKALGKVGTSSVLGEGVVFGEDAVAIAEAVTPHLRAEIPKDHGRFRSVAWYGVLAFDVIFPTGNKGEAKIVHVGST